jgi:hypothetical protein
MSFEISLLAYRPEDKLQTSTRAAVTIPDDGNAVQYQYVPVPYTIGFNLYVYVKNAEDGTKIIEQILPFFTPAFTPRVDMIPGMNEYRDVPITLVNVQIDDVYEGSMVNRKALVWTLGFTMKTFFYGPVRTNPVIKFANTNFYVATTNNISDAVGNTDIVVNIHTQPGLTANGTPTSNAAESVAVSQILATDDFGYVTDINEYDT